jgi:phosphoribosylamine-glycine ligase
VEGTNAPRNPSQRKKFIVLQTSAGPVMGGCVVGDTIEDARNSVYELVKRIGFEANVFDRIIGDRE